MVIQQSVLRFCRAVAAMALVLFALILGSAQARAGNSAVIFMYHRFGEGEFPSTSIKIEQFEAHLAELKSGGYTVMALADIVKALNDGEALPDRAVALTIDDAYLSVYEQAWPRLRKMGYPFTVFVSTGPVDRGVEGHMSWEQIREMDKAGATIGNHTVSHLHMGRASLADNRRELDHSSKRLLKELGYKPDLFAYPYGEASQKIAEMVQSNGFMAAFGQHSGAATKNPDMFYLPRYSMNEKYGDIDRFRLAANTLALDVVDITPADPLISKGDDNPPALGFTVIGSPAVIKSLNRLACFASHEGKLEVMRLEGEVGQTRIEVRMNEALPGGRTRLNCTLPAPEGRWYWFGRQFTTQQ